MKNSRLLLLVPVVLLSSCGAPKEINRTKAQEIALQIKAEDVGSYEFNLHTKGGRGKDSNRIEEEYTYKLQYTSNGYYTYFKGYYGKPVNDIEMYCVKNTEYEEVKFVRYFDYDKNEYVKSVAVKKDNEEYDTAFAVYGANRPMMAATYYFDVEALMAIDQLEECDTMKFYSSNDNSLTIELLTDVKNPDPSSETTLKGKTVYKYENNCFVSTTTESTSNYDNKWSSKGTAKYNSNIKVELPSDWKNYLKLEA